RRGDVELLADRLPPLGQTRGLLLRGEVLCRGLWLYGLSHAGRSSLLWRWGLHDCNAAAEQEALHQPNTYPMLFQSTGHRMLLLISLPTKLHICPRRLQSPHRMNVYVIVLAAIVLTLLTVSLTRLNKVKTKADYLVA